MQTAILFRFLFHDQAVGAISQLIILFFVVLGLYRRKRDGYFVPGDMLIAFELFAARAAVIVFLAGFQLINYQYYYAVQRIFTLPATIFLFMAIMKYPAEQIAPEFHRERNAIFLVMGLEIVLNLGWLASGLIVPDAETPVWFDIIRNTLLPLNMAWLAWLAHRRYRTFLQNGDEAASVFMARNRWVFLVAVCITVVSVTRDWIRFSSEYHTLINIYGWMILYVAILLIFLVSQKNESSLLNRVFLIVPPFLFFAVSLTTLFFSLSVSAYHNNAQNLEEENVALRLILISEIALTVFLVLVLPRLLRAILPDKIAKPADPVPVHHSVPVHLTSRQRVVMGLLAEDLSNKQIAIKLNITERTVKFHITSLMTEFGVHNRYELGRLARKMIEGKEL